MNRSLPFVARCLVPLASLALAGCAERTPVPSLPMNVRPQMALLRNDSRSIAQALKRKRPYDAREAATRLENTWLARKVEGVPEPFLAFEKGLRKASRELGVLLKEGTLEEARAGYQAVLQTCNSCHATYRPGGAADSLLR